MFAVKSSMKVNFHKVGEKAEILIFAFIVNPTAQILYKTVTATNTGYFFVSCG